MAYRTLLTLSLFFIIPRAVVAMSVVINEIQIAGQTSRDEFVEFYNPTDASVDLTGWRLSKKTATGNAANLVTTFPSMSIAAHGFLLITHPSEYKGTVTADLVYSTSGTIAEDNTVILYRDAGDTIVDRVGTGKASDREGSAAPNPDAGQSIARRDGGDTDNNSADFIITAPTPTNRSGNIGSTPPPQQTKTESPAAPQPSLSTIPKASAPDIVVSEFYPNPPGPDDEEFIELKNIGSAALDLSGWEVGTSRGRHFVLANGTTISPGAHLFLPRATTGLALENSGDVVSLFMPEEERPLFTVRYTTDAPEEQSYARSEGGKRWQWTTTRTPGATNVLTNPPLPPVLTFVWTPQSPKQNDIVGFDASDSFDPDQDAITFAWDFGDDATGAGANVTHTYATGGRYIVRLTATTQRGEKSILEKTVIVEGDAPAKVIAIQNIVEGEDSVGHEQVVEETPVRVVSAQLTRPKRNAAAQGTIRGTVLVSPGRFGKTRTLVTVGDRLITAQYSTGTWPALAEGAVVTLAGRQSPTDPDRFLVSAVVAIDEGSATPAEPRTLAASEWEMVAPGAFVTVRGEITERHGSTFFVDDGSGEVRVQIKATTGIPPTSIEEGSTASITGVVLNETQGKILAPRGLEDIVIDTAQRMERTSFPWTRVNVSPWWLLGIIVAGACIAAGLWMGRKKKPIAPAGEPPGLDDDG